MTLALQAVTSPLVLPYAMCAKQREQTILFPIFLCVDSLWYTGRLAVFAVGKFTICGGPIGVWVFLGKLVLKTFLSVNVLFQS